MPALPSRDLQHGLSDFQSAVIAIVRCPIPVLAVVQGTAAGFGFDLALACDMRLAGSSATFTSAFARIGLVPDGGSTFTLPRLVGVGRAMRMLMTGETLDAQEALSIGMVEEVIEDSSLDSAVTTHRERAARVGSAPASAASSVLLGPRRSAHWSRRSPPRARPSCRRCRARSSASRLEAFAARLAARGQRA